MTDTTAELIETVADALRRLEGLGVDVQMPASFNALGARIDAGTITFERYKDGEPIATITWQSTDWQATFKDTAQPAPPTPDHQPARRQGAAMTDTTTAHSCDNCEGIAPATCLANPNRPRDTAAETPTAVLRRAADLLEETVTDCPWQQTGLTVAELLRAIADTADGLPEARDIAFVQAAMATARAILDEEA